MRNNILPGRNAIEYRRAARIALLRKLVVFKLKNESPVRSFQFSTF